MSIDCPTVIPYVGGKVNLGKTLIPMFPKHNRYIEVFFGGGSIFFRKDKASINVLNDKHSDLVNLYMSILSEYDEFMSECNSLLKSRFLYVNLREYLKEDIEFESMPDIKRASRYFYCIQNAFNSGLINPISKTSDWGENTWNSLEESRRKLDNTMIENLDFRELLKRYPPKDDDFWYLDPPYYIAGERGDYYLHSLSNEDHLDLFNMVNELDSNGAKFMVSYDDHEDILDMYSGYNIVKIPVKYSAQIHSDELKNEIVITNYDRINEQLTII